jgi:hypothetical protein
MGSWADWEAYFHDHKLEPEKEEFDWSDWVQKHIEAKEWNQAWKTIDASALGKTAEEAHNKLIAPELGCPPEIAKDLSLLCIYDLVLLLGKFHF